MHRRRPTSRLHSSGHTGGTLCRGKQAFEAICHANRQGQQAIETGSHTSQLRQLSQNPVLISHLVAAVYSPLPSIALLAGLYTPLTFRLERSYNTLTDLIDTNTVELYFYYTEYKLYRIYNPPANSVKVSNLTLPPRHASCG